MERLPNIEQKNLEIKNHKIKIDAKAIEYIRYGLFGLLIGIGAFMTLLSEFGLSWSIGECFEGSVVSGLIESWNTAARNIAGQNGAFFTQLSGGEGESGLFLTVLLLFLIALSIAIVMSKQRWLAVLYALLVLIPTILWGMNASVISIAILALGVILFLLNAKISAGDINLSTIIYTLAIVVVAFVLMSVPAISKLADRPAAIDNIRESVKTSISESYYGKSSLYDGNLKVKKRSVKDETALEVTMDNPEAMYLRGFVGDVLNKDGWEPLSTATYYDAENLGYWLNNNGFNALGQLGQAKEYADKGGSKALNSSYVETTNEITIKNVGGNSKYAYIPYEITIDGVDDAKNWGNNYLTAGSIGRLKEYSYTTRENATSTWTETAAKFYTNKVTAADQENYLLNESYYNSYVYEKYTYISDSDREILDAALGGDGGDQKLGHVEYNTAIKTVKQLIANNFTYTKKLTGHKQKRSALKNIFVTRSGYDTHFATAATMMFRYYGIPARYVEGYIITSDEASVSSGKVMVSKKNAHAWTEIYVDGIGFVPVEVCPTYENLVPQADYSIGIKTKSSKDTPDKSSQNDEDPNVQSSGSTGDSSKNQIPRIPLLIIGIILGIALIILMILGIIRLVKLLKSIINRRKLFKDGEPREAVRAIYRHMEKLDLPIDEETRNIGNKASYSVYNISESDRQAMLIKIKKLKDKKKSNKKVEKVITKSKPKSRNKKK